MEAAWLALLRMVALFVVSTFAYEVTVYYEPGVSLSAYASYIDGTGLFASRVTYTSTFPQPHSVVVPSTITPKALTATTTVSERVTIVSMLIPTGVGSPLNTATEVLGIFVHYYVQLTYSRCRSYEAAGKYHSIDPITTLVSLSVPYDVRGHIVGTSTNTSVGVSGTTTETLYQYVVNPSTIDPIDLAWASFSGQPDGGSSPTCFRETKTVDYRSFCSERDRERASSSGPKITTAPATTSALHCGDSNPCCYGCHAYGPPFGTTTDLYICDDGRQLYPDGSDIPPSAPLNQNNDNPSYASSIKVDILLLGLGLLVGLAFLL